MNEFLTTTTPSLISKNTMIRSKSDAHSIHKMYASNKDHLLISRAQEVACKSPMQMRHGCVLARGSKVISTGFNNYGTAASLSSSSSSSFNSPLCSCHAEMSALYRAGLLNSRLKRPCVLCGKTSHGKRKEPCLSPNPAQTPANYPLCC